MVDATAVKPGTRSPGGEVLNLLALVPPDQQGAAPSRYSFLSEELEALAARGVVIHTASPYVTQTREHKGIKVHPLPGFFRIEFTLRGLLSLRDRNRSESLPCATWTEKQRMARHQKGIESIVRRHHIDLIYSPFAWPGGTAGVPAGLATRTPVVVGLRGSDVLVEPSIGYGQLLDTYFARRICKSLASAAHGIAVSQALAEAAISLGCPPERVSVVLKGVDTVRFSPGCAESARRSLRLPQRPTILFVGNFVPSKGISTLIDAFAKLRAEMPELQLVLCGDGPERERLCQHVRSLGLDESVCFPGRVSREVVPDYFRAADVFVLPSLSEGSGNVLVEAGACGKPLVGAAVGGIPDYIEDGVTGFLFEKANSEDLAAKLRRLFRDPELAERLGRAARVRVENRHQYGQMLNQLLAIFESVLHQAKQRGRA
jgi:glycosyltransferase involved in cell wall biosynthesis